jgi:superfamily II DNA/RNA helicase
MMENPGNMQNEVLRKLEEIEAQNASIGTYEFIKLQTLAECTGIDEGKLIDVVASLQERDLLIWDKNVGVRSRTGHILFCLVNSVSRSRYQEPLRNVSDLKYMRYVKQIPRYIIDLNDSSTEAKFDEILKFGELENEAGPLVGTMLNALATRFPKISEFQLRSTLQILRMLTSPGPNSNLVLVADTGGGKSFAYQLPLFLWILDKKMRAYLSGRKHVNCSALLVFPRNVLAEDQSEELVSLGQLITRQLERLHLPTDFRESLAFKSERDFGGVPRKDLARIYESRPDIIVTNTETMKRRLMNPVAHQVYRNGIDFVLYDEIHLYYGLHGAFVAGLNARLKAILSNVPVFAGMSATIAKPEKHCQRLFALQSRPTLISDRDDVLENKVVEHHAILKPRAGRSPLGVAIDATSCLLHNRRDGIANSRSLPPEQRSKSICFSDSLDITGRWRFDQNDLEMFEPRPIPPQSFWRGYPFYFAPARRSDAIPHFGESCVACHESRDVICSVCEHYSRGSCWWFSQDSGDAGSWTRIGRGVDLYIPNDNIRSRRLTSQEVEFEPGSSIYDLYRDGVHYYVGGNRIELGVVDVDNIIATSVLEVGVDFQGIKEIVMFGEIQSPASYKQKCGRGAREGNTADGLFVMTVVPPMPLANFYYRHFYRLVKPSLSPVPLEPSNPDSLKSHAFASVLDYLARRGVNIFNVIEIKEDEAGIEAEFERALSLIHNERSAVEEHVRRYLQNTGNKDEEIVSRAVHEAERLLLDLSEPIELEEGRKKFVNWIFMGSRDPHILRSLREKIGAEFDNISAYVQSTIENERKFVEATRNLKNALDNLGTSYREMVSELEKLGL